MWIIGANPEPSAQPLDLTEVTQALRLSSDEATGQALMLAAAIAGARVACETFIGRKLINRSVELWGERWNDEGDVYRCGRLHLPLPGVSSITSITYLDTNGAAQTWDSSTGWDKVLPAGDQAERAVVFPRYGQRFPSVRLQPASIKITYVTGYGADYSNVPQRLRQGMLLYVGEAYKNREVSTSGTIIQANPVGAEAYWWPFRSF